MKASSESGLWATVISRTWPAEPLPGALAVSDTTVIMNSRNLLLDCVSCGAAPAIGNGGGEHYFDNFGGDEPVQAEVCGLRQRMGEDVEPGQPSGEQQNLGQKPSDGGTQEALRPALEDIAREESDEGIHHQESAGWAKQLGDPARTCGIENRQTDRAFDKIKRERREAATAAQHHPDQQDTHILHCQRDWR